MARARPPGAEARDEDFVLLVRQLDAWKIPAGALDRVHDAARASLAEVKALTEYQDGKASRLLTVVAFLSALVAAAFTRFAGDFGWPAAPARASADYLLPAATYAAFLGYVLIVTIAVLIVIHAIRPTFNLPETWKGAGRPGRPRSMLFFGMILDVKAPAWGQSFEDMAGEDGHELKARYAKNYITEAYLVAGKVATKLALLKRGIAALEGALVVLLLFLLLFGATTFIVGPTKTAVPAAHPPANAATGVRAPP